MKVNEQNYVEEAERTILELKKLKDNRNGREIPMVTTSKLRNLLAMAADIYNSVLNCTEDRLPEDICSRIEYLRVRFLYEAGREPSVRNLVEKADIVNLLKEVKGSKKKYILFNRYMEALVAYHRYYGGKEN
ncbi:MAG: type III-A CRISPR-associated protein Csm2 [Lachnospiraceae bacterium]|nr:type III-A CRISPR-associated protein Csm2 [Lachnospiraceae bacterium]